MVKGTRPQGGFQTHPCRWLRKAAMFPHEPSAGFPLSAACSRLPQPPIKKVTPTQFPICVGWCERCHSKKACETQLQLYGLEWDPLADCCTHVHPARFTCMHYQHAATGALRKSSSGFAVSHSAQAVFKAAPQRSDGPKQKSAWHLWALRMTLY